MVSIEQTKYISDATYIKAVQSILENSPVYCGICSYGSAREGRICIEKPEDGWSVYFYEKGQRAMIKRHRNAKEACVDLIGRVSHEESVKTALCLAFMGEVNRLAGGDKRFNPTIRKNARPGMRVSVVLKEDQPTGKLTAGTVQKVLTRSSQHYRGIKVMLEGGLVGRVQVIYGQDKK